MTREEAENKIMKLAKEITWKVYDDKKRGKKNDC